jgi:pectate lyase
MFLPTLARTLVYLLSIGFLLGARIAVAANESALEVLPAADGWAATAPAPLPLGPPGGSDAAPRRTVTVTSRAELVGALAWPDASPKLILVEGTIDANVDDAGKPLTCKDYERPDPSTGEPYSLHAFMAMYDPQGSRKKIVPFGGQENARAASAAAQEKRVHILVPPNTTIFGLGSEATLVGVWLDVRPQASAGSQPMNVIIRNLTFLDTADCFPEWTPDDGPLGNWNSAYDSISIRNATHVWIDHNRFEDRETADSGQPQHFGRPFQVHDGFVDITSESDCVTVSWNQFVNHDKAMLIGSSDSATQDRGRLRVTLHHNLFDSIGQRAPRVRFGQVHVYNNVYRVDRNTNYRSSWGLGTESQVYAENNYFEVGMSFGPFEAIDGKQATRATTVGNCWREKESCLPTDLLAAWNERSDPDLKPDAGWRPTLYGPASNVPAMPDSAESARERVVTESGPGKLR